MRAIPFLTSNPDLFARAAAVARACPEFDADLVPVGTAAAALEYLDLEMPDLAFVNFSDPTLDGPALLDTILKDPWLHYAGLVGFCDDDETVGRLEKAQGANLVAVVPSEDLERSLPTILGVLVRNQRILFQRGIGSGLMQTHSGSFLLHNDVVEARCYANLLCNFLFNTNRINARTRLHLDVALVEMLTNAIEHGNCGITYQEKSEWLLEGNAIRALIDRKCESAAVRGRQALFEYTITPDRSTFHIADEGDGFDWRALDTPPSAESVFAPNGRGIQLTRRFTKNLRYNEKGNEVWFEVEHQPDCVNARPALFEDIAPTEVAAGEVVFREGEPGDCLYHIAKGEYEVIVQGRAVSRLSPDDVLMGEMAFLLNNRRTATVRAVTPGTLTRMSKKDFVEAIKQRPHYGLFLARLLAQRVQRAHGERLTD